jgi:hypothetical protein
MYCKHHTPVQQPAADYEEWLKVRHHPASAAAPHKRSCQQCQCASATSVPCPLLSLQPRMLCT